MIAGCWRWAWLGVFLLAGCSSPQTVTVRGQIKPPAATGLADAPGLPGAANTALWVLDLDRTLGDVRAATVLNGRGEFSFELRTDTLPAAGSWVKLAWPHPTRGGILLERSYQLRQGQTGLLEGDLTDLSTLTTLAIEAERVLQPALVRETPLTYENFLVNAMSSSRTLQLAFQQRFYAYLGGGSTAPGSDANLAQDAVELLFQ